MTGVLRKHQSFLAFSSTGKRQAAFGTSVAQANLDYRENVDWTFSINRERDDVYECSMRDLESQQIESEFVTLSLNYENVSLQTLARWTSYFMGAAANPVNQTAGTPASPTGFKIHTISRSTNDALPVTSFVLGYDGDTQSPRIFKSFACNSMSLDFARRSKISLTVELFGSYQFTDTTSAYVIPRCTSNYALQTKDVAITYNSVDYTPNVWTSSFELNNNIPTGDDAFPYNSKDISVLERGEQPTYNSSVQVYGSYRDTLAGLAEAESSHDLSFTINDPSEAGANVIYSFPNTGIKYASEPNVFVGELNKTAINLDLQPFYHRTYNAPLRCTITNKQSVAYLAT